ncbi:MAG: hypothetical protein EXS63_05440 [Candidatus Omnitrophica bacterium]|nr:hypothetical protein [Candidatus Omnitrophota bacterium]
MFNHPWVAWVLIAAMIVTPSCATTTGPQVSSEELATKTSELETKAAHYKATQLQRVRMISERLIGFMLLEDRRKVQGLTYEVTEDADMNASVQLGRKIVVNYGMLRFTESDDQLAVVIAHELGHVACGHIGKKLGTNLVSAMIGLAAGAAIDTVAPGIGSPVTQGISKGLSAGFSRDYEREADYYGFQLAYRAGFDLAQGAKIWERLAIEAPKTMTASFFSTHPPSPERLIRADKTLQQLEAEGVSPAVFSNASPAPRALSIPVRALNMAAGLAGSMLPASSFTPSGSSPSMLQQLEEVRKKLTLKEKEKAKGQEGPDESSAAALAQKNAEIYDLKKQIQKLEVAKAQDEQEEAENQKKVASQQIELEKALFEAKEAAKEFRYAEFGVMDMGIAKKVTNLWVGKRVSGEQRIFSVQQKNIDWFVQYYLSSANSWKALALQRRHYRGYWYAPDGRLYQEQDFLQAQTRADFAKTSLEWDPDLGDRVIGKWMLRIFENGKLLDERTFEVVRT